MLTRRARHEAAVALVLVAVGAALAAGTAMLPSEGGYAGIGPNFMPAVVSGGVLVVGAWLLLEALTGGWRNRSADSPAERGEHPLNAAAFAWVSAGLLAQMALISHVGFTASATALFVFVARGFGSERWLRDTVIGLVLAGAVYLFFTRALSVNLPAGKLFGG